MVKVVGRFGESRLLTMAVYCRRITVVAEGLRRHVPTTRRPGKEGAYVRVESLGGFSRRYAALHACRPATRRVHTMPKYGICPA